MADKLTLLCSTYWDKDPGLWACYLAAFSTANDSVPLHLSWILHQTLPLQVMGYPPLLPLPLRFPALQILTNLSQVSSKGGVGNFERQSAFLCSLISHSCCALDLLLTPGSLSLSTLCSYYFYHIIKFSVKVCDLNSPASNLGISDIFI